MNPVGADPPAGHDHQIAGPRGLLLAGASVDGHGQAPDGAAEDQRLAQVAAVEDLPAAPVRDAALVAAVDHPFVYAVAYAPRMQQALG